ncbi:MAG: hypothetical protein J6P83_07340 [Bacteroidales bacterium]|jgi:hypothetical protein|nr:hypothetical protein [Bacteroidales bacterium]
MKVYVFGIGGTGSRVMRAMTMLLASGVECKADAIVPIIVDPDAAGGDVERAATLMRHYGEIRSKLDFSSKKQNRFFRTEIMETMPNFRLPLSNTEDCRFDEYMDLSGMSKENKALARLLFSQKNLDSDMKIGFKGNPNVGSVVLNQFEDSIHFQNFANDFTAQDKIFIISSIFGGTGASGFPLLLKTLRTSNNIANPNLVNNAHIGAITVLPYFQVQQDDESSIDSATFVSKAKSALSYYLRSISQNNTIDDLYYVGDDTRTTYENVEGGAEQKNNAHFVELISALALIDFANSQNPNPERSNAEYLQTVHKEFGIEKDSNEITFVELGQKSKKQLRKPMTQFLLFAKYLDEYRDFMSQPWVVDRKFDDNFFDSDFISTLKTVQSEYIGWLAEMAGQQRAFTPFNLHRDPNRVFDLVKGNSPRGVFFDKNFKFFDNRLNGTRGESKSGEKEQQFAELFYLATEKLVKDKLNID